MKVNLFIHHLACIVRRSWFGKRWPVRWLALRVIRYTTQKYLRFVQSVPPVVASDVDDSAEACLKRYAFHMLMHRFNSEEFRKHATSKKKSGDRLRTSYDNYMDTLARKAYGY